MMNEQKDNLMQTRATLLNKLKNWQDEASWQRFFDTYWKLIYWAARRTGLRDDEARDVVQETMLAVARRMPGFVYDPAIGSFRAWLKKQTRWSIVNQLRKRDSRLAQLNAPTASDGEEDPIDQLPDLATVSDQFWEAEWQKNLLEAAVARVKNKADPLNYQIYDLYVNREWPAQKVAATFGINVPQVYVIKHRISKMIAEEGQRLEKQMT